ncbi:MAG: nuclear transport factor 2 family protein [Acidimicrobiia bacterium]
MPDDLIDYLTGCYRDWFDALGSEGIGPLDSMLADEWTYTNYDGVVRDKTEYLDWVAGVAESAVFVGPNAVEVRRYVDVALVFGGYQVLLPSDDVLELRFTGVWLWRDDRWQCLMHHNSEVTG